eukprot:241184_1
MSEPWQITLVCMRLVAALYSTLKQSCYKVQAEEREVLKDMDAYGKDMNALRNSLDHYESIEDAQEQRDTFSKDEDSIRGTFHGIQQQLLIISNRQNRIHSILAILRPIESEYLPKLEQRYRTMLDRHFTIHNNIFDVKIFHANLSKCEQLIDKKHLLHELIFGYIGAYIEDEYNVRIPASIKLLCCVFYGNLMMDSDILNTNQINCVSYVLQAVDPTGTDGWKNTDENVTHFYAEKIFDSDRDEMQLLDCHSCNDVENTITVICTNYNHIIATISHLSYRQVEKCIRLRHELSKMPNDNDMEWKDDAALIQQMEKTISGVSLLLQCPYSEIPQMTRLGEFVDNNYFNMMEAIVHFPNDYVVTDANQMNQMFLDIDRKTLDFAENSLIDDRFVETLKVVKCEVFSL